MLMISMFGGLMCYRFWQKHLQREMFFFCNWLVVIAIKMEIMSSNGESPPPLYVDLFSTIDGQ